MADLLTHVLVAYVIGSLLAWRYEWFSSALVTAVMAGALLPDLRKIFLVLPGSSVSEFLSIPFSWAPLHDVGGIVIVIAIAVVLVPTTMRLPVLLCLSLGAFEHILFDAFLYWPDGLTWNVIWPVSNVQFAVDGFYKSWDMVPLAITLGLATLVLVGSWYRRSRPTGPPTPQAPTSLADQDDDADVPSAPIITMDRYERGGLENSD